MYKGDFRIWLIIIDPRISITMVAFFFKYSNSCCNFLIGKIGKVLINIDVERK